MAGEWSKKIGEEGERIALKLMEIIGWENLQKGLDIPCLYNELHERKKSHGLDGLFSYSSPLQDRLLRHVCISVKYHDDGYPTGLSNKFKEHLKQLNWTMDCFDESEIKNSVGDHWNTSVDKEESAGILLWLHGNRDDTSNDDLISKFENLRMPSEAELKNPIMLIDQYRANFIFETYAHVKKNYSDYSVTFNYQRTGINNFDDEIKNNGELLPWELLSSGLLVYRAVKSSPDERKLIVCAIDRFDADGFKRILSFAQRISANLANQIEICFPDYVEIRNGNTVNLVKSSFEDTNFTKTISVRSYKMDLRNE